MENRVRFISSLCAFVAAGCYVVVQFHHSKDNDKRAGVDIILFYLFFCEMQTNVISILLLGDFLLLQWRNDMSSCCVDSYYQIL